jgi:hypothetical protein
MAMESVYEIAGKRSDEQVNGAAHRDHGGPRAKFSDEKLKEAMTEANGNRKKAAEALGVTVGTIGLRLKKMNGLPTRERPGSGNPVGRPPKSESKGELAAGELRKISGELFQCGSDRLAKRIREIAVRLERR